MTSIALGLSCPVPLTDADRVQLGHGSGGRLSAELVSRIFVPAFDNAALKPLGDGALVGVGAETIVVSTDSFVVSPIEFPGGDIGSLAVHGTLNDLAMMGATPVCLTAGYVIEEGFEMARLNRVATSMARAARDAGVPIVAGDTKVVERGKADGLFINTAGVGRAAPAWRPSPERAADGDVVIISGPIGRHGMAIMAAREGLAFESTIRSDSAWLGPLVERLRATGADVHVLRDPTRGGVASALNEIAIASQIGFEIDETAIPVPDDVRAACEMLGLDPLYVANEGVLIAIVAAHGAHAALASLRGHPLGVSAGIIGRCMAGAGAPVVLRTPLGGRRIVDLLPGDQLPRIC